MTTKNEKLQEGIRKLVELKQNLEEFINRTQRFPGVDRKSLKVLISLRKKILRKEIRDIMKATR